MLISANCSVGTKLGFAISFNLNFLFPLLEGVEVDGLFFVEVGLSNGGFGLVVVASVLASDFVGDFVVEVVGVFLGEFVRLVVKVFVGDLVREVVGVFVGDVIRAVVGGFAGDFVEDFPGSTSVGGLGFLVGEGGGDIDGDLGGEGVGEMDRYLLGKGGVAGSSSSTWVGLTSGESSITYGSSTVVPEGFEISKWTVFCFLLEEVVACVASLNASEISCCACFIAASLSGPDVGRSDLFLFFSLVCVGCASNQIWKACCRTFFFILGWLKFNSSSPLRRTFMSSSVESLAVLA